MKKAPIPIKNDEPNVIKLIPRTLDWVCNHETPLIFRNISRNHYECCNCGNVLAIRFKGRIFHPKTVMGVAWNKEIIDYAKKVDGELCFYECRNKKDILILNLMQLMAKLEGESFLYSKFGSSTHNGLFFDATTQKYLGLITWTEEEYKNAPCLILRQIFIMENERKKGYGTKLLQFWVENYADNVNKDLFVIESPNEISQRLLIKLGYASKKNGELQGLKCRFVSGC